MVQWGCCISPWSSADGGDMPVRAEEMFAQLTDVGFEYAELSASSLVQLSDTALSSLVRAMERTGTPVRACNSFVPATIPLVGPQRDFDRIHDYVGRTLTRCAQIGAGTVVFGSGTARHIPDGFDSATALRQLKEFLIMCNDFGERLRIDIVIEPLRKAECNVINSVAQGAALTREVNLPHIRLLADSYHMAAEQEAYGVLDGVADLLGHVHVANGRERRYPGHDRGDVEDLARMFVHLQRSGYARGISVECRFELFVKELPKALVTLREAWATGFRLSEG